MDADGAGFRPGWVLGQSGDRHGALEGLVVLEVSETLAGQVAGGLLADMGATVVRIESLAGAASRGRGPCIAGESDALYFQCENRGKLSVSADWGGLGGDARIQRLVKCADALIDDLGPGRLEELGFPLASETSGTSGLCLLRISAFGAFGPLSTCKSDDRIAQAFGGVQYVTGFPDRPPIPITIPIAEYWTGIIGASGLLIALFHALRSGQSQTVDLAMYEAALRLQDANVAAFGRYGDIPTRTGNESLLVAPAGVYETSDQRWVALSGAGDQPYARLCSVIGRAELITDDRFRTQDARARHSAEINRIIAEWIRAHTSDEAARLLGDGGVAGALVSSASDIIADPHIRARQDVLPLTTQSGRTVLAPGVTPRLLLTPGQTPPRAPSLGEHNVGVEKICTPTSAPSMPADQEASEQYSEALSGIRVLDLGRWLAGPVAASLLADFGAEVIMVELPGARRRNGKEFTRRDLSFLATNRNKRSITVDIRTEAGRQAICDLAAKSDVLVENFRPGTLERWAIGPSELLRYNPGLVILRASGYGQTGPYASRSAFNPVGLALGGTMHLNGWPDRPPLNDGMTSGDYTTALFGEFGVLCALLRRLRDNQGQVVDVSLVESILRLTGDLLAVESGLGIVRSRAGGISPLYPVAVTECAADGRFVAVSAETWEEVADALDAGGATGGQDSDTQGRLSAYIRSMEAEAAVASLRTAGLAASAVQSIADICNSEHIRERGSLIKLFQEDVGEIWLPAAVPRLSRTPGGVRSVPSVPGADNEEVFGELLEYDDLRIAQLCASGAPETGEVEGGR
jgi:crotonobetainyl-CoA:carnitine CoA-transferase CaiB-like acyl-CoA transferase